jgi:hypothetical protein
VSVLSSVLLGDSTKAKETARQTSPSLGLAQHSWDLDLDDWAPTPMRWFLNVNCWLLNQVPETDDMKSPEVRARYVMDEGLQARVLTKSE